MGQQTDIPRNWKSITTVYEAKMLVDYGVLLKWNEIRYFKKAFDPDAQKEIIRHFALRLAERVKNRLPEEIIIESVLVILTTNTEDELLSAFLEELLLQPNYVDACMALVELSIGFDISLMENGEKIFSMAVALICELGIVVHELDKQHPQDFSDGEKILSHISTYLLSVSNNNNNCIRLSLIHYFGYTENSKNKKGFNRIMGRFGYTILEQLFTMLFHKRTEAVSLQYLLENTPYILEGDDNCQKILHETWKFYMLKKPERFLLFVKTLAQYIKSFEYGRYREITTVFLKHLGALLKIASTVNHRVLTQEILAIILTFKEHHFTENLIGLITKDKSIRSTHRDYILDLSDKMRLENEDKLNFRSTKRGRKPSFARVQDLGTIHQVTFLGQKQAVKAS